MLLVLGALISCTSCTLTDDESSEETEETESTTTAQSNTTVAMSQEGGGRATAAREGEAEKKRTKYQLAKITPEALGDIIMEGKSYYQQLLLGITNVIVMWC